MSHQTIKAKDVLPGMSIFSAHAEHSAWKWLRVTGVRSASAEGRTYTVLVTSSYETWKHPEEAVCTRP